MNVLCAAGRHRWVTKQEKGEEPYRQCERCQHYEHTSSWVQGYAYYRPPEGGEGPAAGAAQGGGGFIG